MDKCSCVFAFVYVCVLVSVWVLVAVSAACQQHCPYFCTHFRLITLLNDLPKWTITIWRKWTVKYV